MIVSKFEKFRHGHRLSSCRKSFLFHVTSFIVTFTFVISLILPPSLNAQPLNLPAPGGMVSLSPAFTPVILRGIKVHPHNPLKFDFIVDSGDTDFKGQDLKDESAKLIKYFLASLTIPEKDLWVNLSPFEGEHIIPEELGKTELGRDMLAQDYLLKQLSSTLTYPENELGQKFWDRVRTKAYELYGTRDIPTDTFNKVWIVPQRAEVYETADTAFVSDSYLKVMLEEDYLAQAKGTKDEGRGTKDDSSSVVLAKRSSFVHRKMTSELMTELILPEIEREVNQGANFAPLRQIYNSLILAIWFKKNLKQSLLGQIYVDQNKITGVDVEDKTVKEKIYAQYLEAYKKGVYNYIKEDYETGMKQTIPRKYFSGGELLSQVGQVLVRAAHAGPGLRALNSAIQRGRANKIPVILQEADLKESDQAMLNEKALKQEREDFLQAREFFFTEFETYFGQKLTDADQYAKRTDNYARSHPEVKTVVDEIVDYYRIGLLEDGNARQHLYEYIQEHQSSTAAVVISRLDPQLFHWNGVVPYLRRVALGIAPQSNPHSAARQLKEIIEEKTFGGLTLLDPKAIWGAHPEVIEEAKRVWQEHKEVLEELVKPIPIPDLPKAVPGITPGKIVTIRHGTTTWSVEVLNKWAGWKDAKIVPQGLANATASGAVLKGNIDIDVFFESNLSRSQETLDAVLKGLGLERSAIEVKRSSDLAERHYGLLAGWRRSIVEEIFGAEMYKDWRRQGVRPPGGENIPDVQERAVPYFVGHVLPEVVKGRNVGISGHNNGSRAPTMYLYEKLKLKRKLTSEEKDGISFLLGGVVLLDFNEQLDFTVVGQRDSDPAATEPIWDHVVKNVEEIAAYLQTDAAMVALARSVDELYERLQKGPLVFENRRLVKNTEEPTDDSARYLPSVEYLINQFGFNPNAEISAEAYGILAQIAEHEIIPSRSLEEIVQTFGPFLNDSIDALLTAFLNSPLQLPSEIVANPDVGEYYRNQPRYSDLLARDIENRHYWRYLRLATQDMSATEKVFADRVLRALLEDQRVSGLTLRELDEIVYRSIKLITGKLEPLLGFKQKIYKAAVPALLPQFDRELEGREGEDRLSRALLISLRGNSFGNARFNEAVDAKDDTVLASTLKQPFWFLDESVFHQGRDHRSQLMDDLQGTGKEVLFFLDNMIEDVYDLPLIRELLQKGHKVTLVARAEEAFNDTTVRDMQELLQNPDVVDFLGQEYQGKIDVISSGSVVRGTNLPRSTPELREAWDNADVIILKGEGNRVTMATPAGLTKDVYSLMIVKNEYEFPGAVLGDAVIEKITADAAMAGSSEGDASDWLTLVRTGGRDYYVTQSAAAAYPHLPQDGSPILSLGIGNARDEIFFAQVTKSPVIAITQSEEAKAIAEEKIKAAGLGDRIFVFLADAGKPSFLKDVGIEDGTVGFVYSRMMWHYLTLDELPEGLSAVKRALKPGAKGLFTVKSDKDHFARQRGATFNPVTGRIKFYDPNAQIDGISGWKERLFLSERDFTRQVRAAGLSVTSSLEHGERAFQDLLWKQPADHSDILITVHIKNPADAAMAAGVLPAKEEVLSELRNPHANRIYHAVISDFASDTDTVATALAEAYRIQAQADSKGEDVFAFPVIQGELNDETLFVLEKAGLDPQQFVFMAQDDVEQLLAQIEDSGATLRISLTDHSAIRPDDAARLEFFNQHVVSIIEHHDVAREQFPSRAEIIEAVGDEKVGAVATLLFIRYLEAEIPVPKPIALMLLSAILSDTKNLVVNVTPHDNLVVDGLRKIVGYSPQDRLTLFAEQTHALNTLKVDDPLAKIFNPDNRRYYPQKEGQRLRYSFTTIRLNHDEEGLFRGLLQQITDATFEDMKERVLEIALLNVTFLNEIGGLSTRKKERLFLFAELDFNLQRYLRAAGFDLWPKDFDRFLQRDLTRAHFWRKVLRVDHQGQAWRKPTVKKINRALGFDAAMASDGVRGREGFRNRKIRLPARKPLTVSPAPLEGDNPFFDPDALQHTDVAPGTYRDDQEDLETKIAKETDPRKREQLRLGAKLRDLAAKLKRQEQKEGDQALTAAPGGIDVTEVEETLKIRRDGRGVALPIHMQPPNVELKGGFIPVILDVIPMTTLPFSLSKLER